MTSLTTLMPPVPPPGPPTPTLSVVTLVSDPSLYAQARQSLARQHAAEAIEWLPIVARRGAAEGLNRGRDRARAPWIVCAHQDVVFPPRWWDRVQEQIERRQQRRGRAVALAGPMGVRRDGRFRGCVSDPHGFHRWGPLPSAVMTLDEHVLILRAASGLRFDPGTPGFHCYGADLALQAQRRGLDVIAIDAPVTHRSTGTIDPAFDRAAAWLLETWAERTGGVIPTCATTICRRSLRTAPRRLLVHLNRRLGVARRRLGARSGGRAAGRTRAALPGAGKDPES